MASPVVRVMVWLAVRMGHTWDLCLLYSLAFQLSVQSAEWSKKNQTGRTTMKVLKQKQYQKKKNRSCNWAGRSQVNKWLEWRSVLWAKSTTATVQSDYIDQ